MKQKTKVTKEATEMELLTLSKKIRDVVNQYYDSLPESVKTERYFNLSIVDGNTIMFNIDPEISDSSVYISVYEEAEDEESIKEN